MYQIIHQSQSKQPQQHHMSHHLLSSSQQQQQHEQTGQFYFQLDSAPICTPLTPASLDSSSSTSSAITPTSTNSPLEQIDSIFNNNLTDRKCLNKQLQQPKSNNFITFNESNSNILFVDQNHRNHQLYNTSNINNNNKNNLSKLSLKSFIFNVEIF